MGLQIHPGESKWWYARIVINGRKIKKNLGVEVRGTPPARLTEAGDLAFERSRAKAQAALEQLQAELRSRRTAEELVQTIHEIRTGYRVGSIALKDAGKRWKSLPRRRPLSTRYVAQADGWMKKFVEFVATTNPNIQNMDQVQPTLARAFFRAEEERGVSAKTYNNTLVFLRSCFEALKEEAGIAKNPFAGIPLRDGETVFRKPFTAEELAIIVEKAKADPFIYPLVVTGICTAMRRGDCCTLRRDSVDLKGGFITVKTSKTGEYVQIPIFPLLREVLEKAMAEVIPNRPFMFPALEAHYQINPDHLTDRVRRVMKAAGFFDAEDGNGDGESLGPVSAERKQGLRKASLRDFHSFRVTWVTIALTAGVPLEIVRKVTGHRTAEIVMKHYFQPGREDFRRTLAGKLPALLGGAPDPKALETDELRAKLTAMQPRTWKKIRDELLARLPPEGKAKPAEIIPIETASATG